MRGGNYKTISPFSSASLHTLFCNAWEIPAFSIYCAFLAMCCSLYTDYMPFGAESLLFSDSNQPLVEYILH